jgi:1A family penicillin-binding protein
MSNKPSPNRQLSQVFTQAIQTIQARVNFQGLGIRRGARIAELKIVEGDDRQQTYPLLGDRYTIGRSSRSCDITIRNPVVSQLHFSLERDRKNPRLFHLRDEKSTNGVYVGKRRVKTLDLHHNDVFTLGPPELEARVKIVFYNPPPIWIRGIRYFLFGTAGSLSLFCLWLGIEWSKVPVYPLPTSKDGPVVVYANDEQTALNPLRDTTHKEMESLDEFSPYLPNAVVASEDSRFYWHFGVDPIGVARAISIATQKDGARQGASTLTQQLARSLFSQVGRENTAARKLREAIVALKLEAAYSKEELLRTYLNRVYLGSNNYGFEDAAQFYFDKSAKDLDLNEAATLVAVLPAPNSFNPVQDYDTAIGLRNRIIERMVQQGMVSEEEGDKARRSRIEVSPKARKSLSGTIAPYYYSYVFKELKAILGEELAAEGNLIVETSLDMEVQTKAEKSLRDNVNTVGSGSGFSQGAIVTLNTKTGEVIAMVGGTDYKKSQFNRATDAMRQPGSTFKIFAYGAAIDRGISPYQTYSCEALTWQGFTYKPCERSSGDINMFRGIAQSENAVALRVARDVGLSKVIDLARRMGVSSNLRESPGLVLGESEVSVLEMTGAFATFANNGVWNRPHAIKRILDGADCDNYQDKNTCRVIYSFKDDNSGSKRVVSEYVASTMTSMLRGVVSSGTAKSASIGYGEGGKTGTTNRNVDLWFVGYIPSRQLATGIWLGNDNNSPTRGASSQAAALWGKYMKQIVN